jgi:hypothetical protein
MAMTTPIEIVEALDLVADYYNPRFGLWAYRAFDAINTTFFEGRLPRPLIQWAITGYSRCLGQTAMRDRPIITLHPSIMVPAAGDPRDPREPKGPWSIDWRWFGPLHAFDVLLHESIHVAQRAIHGDVPRGQSSHNDPSWILEVNRLAPLLDLEGVRAGLNRPRRVPIPGEFTERGRPRTRVRRVDEGNVPLKDHSRFPHGVREYLGTAEAYYTAGAYPGGIALDDPRRSGMLVTRN